MCVVKATGREFLCRHAAVYRGPTPKTWSRRFVSTGLLQPSFRGGKRVIATQHDARTVDRRSRIKLNFLATFRHGFAGEMRTVARLLLRFRRLHLCLLLRLLNHLKSGITANHPDQQTTTRIFILVALVQRL